MLESVLAWVSTHPEWAIVIVFSICLLESLAVVGVIVPGMVFLFSVGAFVGHGALNFYMLCIAGILGAIIGDGLSFALGYHYRDRVRGLSWMQAHQQVLARGEAFFHRFGPSSIVIGRFFGPIRAFIPLVAGMFNMPPRQFYLANIFSALIWAPAVLLPGVVAGAALSINLQAPRSLFGSIFLFMFGGWLAYHSQHDDLNKKKSTLFLVSALLILFSALFWFYSTQSLQELHDVFRRVWYVIN